MPSQKKINQVRSINDSLKKYENFVLIKYTGITTEVFEKLRKSLRKTGSTLSIIKNALFEKAVRILSLKNKLFEEVVENFFPLKNPTAIIYFGKDWSSPLKAFHDFISSQTGFSFKIGLLDKIIYDEAEMTKIARLPTKDQLVAQMIANMTGPSRKLVGSLKFNINKFVYILKQKSKGAR